jgi:signal recognition particle GTPase
MAPHSRQIAKNQQLPLEEVRTLLYSLTHEERLVALLILACRYSRSASSSSEEIEEIVKFYLDNMKEANN